MDEANLFRDNYAMCTPFKFGAALVANKRYFLAGRPSESHVDRDSGKGTGGGKGRREGAGGV